MIKFFHTADIHFGVENYGRIDPKTGIHTRLLDFKKSLETCVDMAVEENVDFFLFSGDAYKTAHPTPTQQKLLMQVLMKLYKANIPVIIIVGNHDHPLSFGKANALDVFSQLPIDGFHVISKPELLKLNTKSGIVQIVGIPWPTRNVAHAKDENKYKSSTEITRHISIKVNEIIASLANEIDPNKPAVLAGHLTVSNGIFSGSEKCAIFGTDPLFLPSQLALPMFDYVALGHLHRYQNLNPNGYPAIVYSGSIDRVDFGERKETKGFCRVFIDTNCPPKEGDKHLYNTKGWHEFVPLVTRPFIQIEVELEEGKDHTQQIINEIKKYQIKDSIIKIIYKVPAGSLDKVDLSAVSRACMEAMYIVNIIPIIAHTPRAKRPTLQIQMSHNQLLENYISSHNEFKEMKTDLLTKAESLYSEIEDSVEE